MSTAAVVSAPTTAATKSAMMRVLANKPQSVMADIRSAVAWLPKKVWKAIVRLANFLHIPQAAAFVARNFRKFLNLVGPKAFAVEVATSRWGQATLRTGFRVTAGLTKWAIKTTFRIVTSPIRLFKGGRQAMDAVEAKVSHWNARLTPNSGVCWSPLQAAHDGLAWTLSHERTGIKIIRTIAGASMALSVTRKLIPAGPFRVLSYAVDAVLIAMAFWGDIKDTFVGRRIWKKATEEKAEFVEVVDGVATEATKITREAAEANAAELRKQANRTETEGRQQAAKARQEIIDASVVQATELRAKATEMEAIAQREAAAEAAREEAAATSAVAVMEKPEPESKDQTPPTPAPGPSAAKTTPAKTPPSKPAPPSEGNPKS